MVKYSEAKNKKNIVCYFSLFFWETGARPKALQPLEERAGERARVEARQRCAMSFAHSAYSTMGMSHAREVLKTKMMPKHFAERQAAAGSSRGGSAGKRAKTSAHTSNVNLQAVCHGPLCMLPANCVIVPTRRWRAFLSHAEAGSSGPSCLLGLPSVGRVPHASRRAARRTCFRMRWGSLRPFLTTCCMHQQESDDHDSEYDEDLEDEAAREEEQHEEKDRGPKSWLCPNGCGKTLTVGVGKVYMPTIRFKKDGSPYPTQDSWW